MFIFQCFIILKWQTYPYKPGKKIHIPILKIAKVTADMKYCPYMGDTEAVPIKKICTYYFLRRILRTLCTLKWFHGYFAPSFVHFFYPFAFGTPYTCTQLKRSTLSDVHSRCFRRLLSELLTIFAPFSCPHSALINPNTRPKQKPFISSTKKYSQKSST